MPAAAQVVATVSIGAALITGAGIVLSDRNKKGRQAAAKKELEREAAREAKLHDEVDEMLRSRTEEQLGGIHGACSWSGIIGADSSKLRSRIIGAEMKHLDEALHDLRAHAYIACPLPLLDERCTPLAVLFALALVWADDDAMKAFDDAKNRDRDDGGEGMQALGFTLARLPQVSAKGILAWMKRARQRCVDSCVAALTAPAVQSGRSASAKPLFLETVQEVMENPRLSAELAMAIHSLGPMHVNDDYEWNIGGEKAAVEAMPGHPRVMKRSFDGFENHELDHYVSIISNVGLWVFPVEEFYYYQDDPTAELVGVIYAALNDERRRNPTVNNHKGRRNTSSISTESWKSLLCTVYKEWSDERMRQESIRTHIHELAQGVAGAIPIVEEFRHFSDKNRRRSRGKLVEWNRVTNSSETSRDFYVSNFDLRFGGFKNIYDPDTRENIAHLPRVELDTLKAHAAGLRWAHFKCRSELLASSQIHLELNELAARLEPYARSDLAYEHCGALGGDCSFVQRGIIVCKLISTNERENLMNASKRKKLDGDICAALLERLIPTNARDRESMSGDDSDDSSSDSSSEADSGAEDNATAEESSSGSRSSKEAAATRKDVAAFAQCYLQLLDCKLFITPQTREGVLADGMIAASTVKAAVKALKSLPDHAKEDSDDISHTSRIKQALAEREQERDELRRGHSHLREVLRAPFRWRCAVLVAVLLSTVIAIFVVNQFTGRMLPDSWLGTILSTLLSFAAPLAIMKWYETTALFRKIMKPAQLPIELRTNIGAKFVLKGLSTFLENGRVVEIITEMNAKGRIGVRLPSGKKFSVKPENLAPVEPTEVDVDVDRLVDRRCGTYRAQWDVLVQQSWSLWLQRPACCRCNLESSGAGDGEDDKKQDTAPMTGGESALAKEKSKMLLARSKVLEQKCMTYLLGWERELFVRHMRRSVATQRVEDGNALLRLLDGLDDLRTRCGFSEDNDEEEDGGCVVPGDMEDFEKLLGKECVVTDESEEGGRGRNGDVHSAHDDTATMAGALRGVMHRHTSASAQSLHSRLQDSSAGKARAATAAAKKRQKKLEAIAKAANDAADVEVIKRIAHEQFVTKLGSGQALKSTVMRRLRLACLVAQQRLNSESTEGFTPAQSTTTVEIAALIDDWDFVHVVKRSDCTSLPTAQSRAAKRAAAAVAVKQTSGFNAADDSDDDLGIISMLGIVGDDDVACDSCGGVATQRCVELGCEEAFCTECAEDHELLEDHTLFRSLVDEASESEKLAAAAAAANEAAQSRLDVESQVDRLVRVCVVAVNAQLRVIATDFAEEVGYKRWCKVDTVHRARYAALDHACEAGRAALFDGNGSAKYAAVYVPSYLHGLHLRVEVTNASICVERVKCAGRRRTLQTKQEEKKKQSEEMWYKSMQSGNGAAAGASADPGAAARSDHRDQQQQPRRDRDLAEEQKNPTQRPGSRGRRKGMKMNGKVRRVLAANGWVFTRGKKHYIYKRTFIDPETGAVRKMTTTISSTPSSMHAIKVQVGQLRRTARRMDVPFINPVN